SVLGTNYYLYNGATLVTGASGTSAPLDFGLQTGAGIYTVSATLPGTGCTAVMGSVTITVNPRPTVYTVTGGGNYCAGGTGYHVGLNGSDAGIIYKLLNSGVPTGTAMTGTGSSLDFGIFTAAGTYTIVATNITTGCPAIMGGSAVIIIN